MFEIEITFEIDGKRVSPEEFGDALKQTVLVELREELLAKVRSIRCPDHHQSPRITVKGSASLEEFEFLVSGCCQKVIDATNMVIG